jgi:hypothetical protein
MSVLFFCGSAARRRRNQRRATAILAVLGHGRDAHGTRRRRKRKFLVKKTRIYGIALQVGGTAKENQKAKGKCQRAKVKSPF